MMPEIYAQMTQGLNPYDYGRYVQLCQQSGLRPDTLSDFGSLVGQYVVALHIYRLPPRMSYETLIEAKVQGKDGYEYYDVASLQDNIVTAPAITSQPQEKPSFLDMIASATKAGVEFAKSGFKVADDEKRHKRIEICNDNCINDDGRCPDCGCFMAIKAAIDAMKCPRGKW